MGYDCEEASRLLYRAAGTTVDVMERMKAVDGLFTALVSLNEKFGATIKRDRARPNDGLYICVGNATAVVLRDHDACVLVGVPSGQKMKVPLAYNPATKELESLNDDASWTPEPGQRRPPRSAVAEVVALALQLIVAQVKA